MVVLKVDPLAEVGDLIATDAWSDLAADLELEIAPAATTKASRLWDTHSEGSTIDKTPIARVRQIDRAATPDEANWMLSIIKRAAAGKETRPSINSGHD
jgi:hypothetical protein